MSNISYGEGYDIKEAIRFIAQGYADKDFTLKFVSLWFDAINFMRESFQECKRAIDEYENLNPAERIYLLNELKEATEKMPDDKENDNSEWFDYLFSTKDIADDENGEEETEDCEE